MKSLAHGIAAGRRRGGYEGILQQRDIEGRERYFPDKFKQRHTIDMTIPANWYGDWGISDVGPGLAGMLVDAGDAYGYDVADPRKKNFIEKQALENLSQFHFKKPYNELKEQEKYNLTHNFAYTEGGLNPAYQTEVPYQLGLWDAMITKDLAQGLGRGAMKLFGPKPTGLTLAGETGLGPAGDLRGGQRGAAGPTGGPVLKPIVTRTKGEAWKVAQAQKKELENS